MIATTIRVAPSLAATVAFCKSRDFNLIPIGENEKGEHKEALVRWKPYQDVVVTDAELSEWMTGRLRQQLRAFAVVTGSISGIVVVDSDTEVGEAWCRSNLPTTPWMVQTARGFHRYYRHGGHSVSNRVGEGEPRVDVRGDGGYAVAPLSVHHTGAIYEPMGDWTATKEDLPVYDPAWLEPLFPEPPPVSRPDSAILQTALDQSPVEIMRRVTAYVAECPPAIEGRGGDHYTYVMAARMVRDFALSDADAFLVLQEWNQRCVPPWTAKDLKAKIRSARKSARSPKGLKLLPPPTGHCMTTADNSSSPPTTVAPKLPTNSESLTEWGDAECFATLHGDKVKFDKQNRRWLCLHDRSGLWRLDTANAVFQFAEATMEARRDAADPDRDAKARDWAKKGFSHARLCNTVKLAENQPRLIDTGDGWDADNYLVGSPTGLIDLRTGTLRPALPGDRVTRSVACEFDPNAKCPLWEATLREIFPVDADLMIDWPQRAIGYNLTGETKEEVFFVLHGTGRNGKGTIVNTLSHIFGGYAETLDATSLQSPAYQPSSGAPTPDLATLPGTRFVTASEFSRAPLNETRLKRLSGRDPIACHGKYMPQFTFMPQFKLWLSMDKAPNIPEASDGFWQRMRLLPFTVSFAGREDVTLKDRLRAEAPGILAWVVRGAVMWQSRGLSVDMPVEITRASTAMKDAQEPTADFVAEALVRVSDKPAVIGARDLYTAYCTWYGCRDPKYRLSETAFGRSIGKQFASTKQEKGKVYVGVRLVTNGEKFADRFERSSQS